MTKHPHAQKDSAAQALQQLQAKLGKYTGSLPEIRFASCPKCGPSPSNPTFAVNPEKGCFKCHRASCGYKGHLSQLASGTFDIQKNNTDAQEALPSSVDRAVTLWDSCSQITRKSVTADYLASRGIDYGTVRHLPMREFDRGAAVIGMTDRNGRLRAVNYSILNDGRPAKRYLGAKKHAFAVLKESQRVIVAEGTVTGLSVLQHLVQKGYGLVIAGDAANMAALADPANKWVLKDKREVILAADNDIDGGGRNAAMAVYSAFPGICKIKIPSRPGSDWNDILTAQQMESEWVRG